MKHWQFGWTSLARLSFMPNKEGEVQPSAFVIEIERDARHKLGSLRVS